MPFDDEEDADMKLFFVCSFVLYFRFLNEKKKKKIRVTSLLLRGKSIVFVLTRLRFN